MHFTNGHPSDTSLTKIINGYFDDKQWICINIMKKKTVKVSEHRRDDRYQIRSVYIFKALWVRQLQTFTQIFMVIQQ